MGCPRNNKFIKYKIYKPIRNWLSELLYGEYLPDKRLIERRRKFYEKISRC